MATEQRLVRKNGNCNTDSENGKSRNNMFMPKTTTQAAKTSNTSTTQTNTNNVNKLVRSVNSKEMRYMEK